MIAVAAQLAAIGESLMSGRAESAGSGSDGASALYARSEGALRAERVRFSRGARALYVRRECALCAERARGPTHAGASCRPGSVGEGVAMIYSRGPPRAAAEARAGASQMTSMTTMVKEKRKYSGECAWSECALCAERVRIMCGASAERVRGPPQAAAETRAVATTHKLRANAKMLYRTCYC